MADVTVHPLHSDGRMPVELVYETYEKGTGSVTHRLPIKQASEINMLRYGRHLSVRYEGNNVDSYAIWEHHHYNNTMNILVGSSKVLAASWKCDI